MSSIKVHEVTVDSYRAGLYIPDVPTEKSCPRSLTVPHMTCRNSISVNGTAARGMHDISKIILSIIQKHVGGHIMDCQSRLLHG